MGFLCPQEFVDLAHLLADAAQPIARRYFRQDDMGMENKADHSPVTLADKSIEEKWRSIIFEKRPQDGIWGEEFGRHNEDAELTWIFDPIDGTKDFTLGRTTFGMLIGLYHKEHGFILGLVDQPIVNLRWFGAKGRGATLNGEKLQTKNPAAFSDIRISLSNPLTLTPDLKKMYDHLAEKVAFTYYGGACWNYIGVSDRSVHITFDTVQQIYDIAATIPIIEEAGGKITHKDGSKIEFTASHTVLATCTPELHDQVMAIYKEANA